jgi:FkbM family methyltransferase
MNTEKNSPNCQFVQHVFKHVTVPRNVKVRQWYQNMRITRIVKKLHHAISDRLFGSSWFSAEGSFQYNKSGAVSSVTFNGRNEQFHALYENHYKYAYEFETALLLTRLLSNKGAFYDVGANWGYFSLLAAASPVFNAKIYSFEPNPETFVDLGNAVEQAGLQDRVSILNCGLGSEETELFVEIPDKFKSGLSRLTKTGAGKPIPVHAIDKLGLEPPEVIKIDAEGMETDVLKGGESTIQTHKPFIVFENFLNYSDPALTVEAITLLKNWGYQIFNPALVFSFKEQNVLVSYGDPIEHLIKHDSAPRTSLIEISETNRFLMRHQLNVFACHASRVLELSPDEFFKMSQL